MPLAAFLQEGMIYLCCDAEPADNTLMVRCGSDSSLFEKIGHPPKLNLCQAQTFLPLIVDNSAQAYSSSNEDYPDFFLEGRENLGIAIPPIDQPIDIPIITDYKIPQIWVGEPCEFAILVGTHRCTARISITVTGSDDSLIAFGPYQCDPTYLGGKAVEDFQSLRVKLPELKPEVTYSLSVDARYLSFLGREDEINPFLFLAAPALRSLRGDPNRPAAKALYQAKKSRSFNDPETWMVARLPTDHLITGKPFAIQSANGDLSLNPEELAADPIVVIEDHGFVLKVSSASASSFLIYLNDAPYLRLDFAGSDSQLVQIPRSHRIGNYVKVDFRDTSGSVTSLTHWTHVPKSLTPLSWYQQHDRPPYPPELSVASSFRYRSLQLHLSRPAESTPSHHDLGLMLEALERGPTWVQAKPFKLPTSSKPKVTIIIPCHNQFNYSYLCLCAIGLAWNETPYEVIIVDDASSDSTGQLAQLVAGISYLRVADEAPLGFIKACNYAASHAQGEYIVLLNNDTEPCTQWLDELCDAFSRFDKVGIAGAKLLFPSGSLQDAGGIVWNSGNPWNYGRDANPWEPRFCYSRQVDYVSGAALMISHSLWKAIDGLSEYLEPMYFEDTDLAFKARKNGYTTWLIPSSIVIHHEGVTSGTDISTGFKKYQETNRPKFKQKWSSDFSGFGREGDFPDLEKDRNIRFRVLFVDYQICMPNRDAGSYAASSEIDLLQSLGAKVTFLPANLANLGTYSTELQRRGVEVVTAPFYLSLEEFLRERAGEFDLAYVNRYNVAEQVNRLLREITPRTRIILNLADLHYLRLLRSATLRNSESEIRNALRVQEAELNMIRQSDIVLTYTSEELAVIDSATTCQVKGMIAPWVVSVPDSIAPYSLREGLSFLGSYTHHPNLEGVRWFAENVTPALVANNCNAVLHLYGSGMSEELLSLKSETIDPHGYIENVADAYEKHLVFIAPLVSGAGIKGKVINAIAHGVPCVLSPFAAEGVGLRHGFDCLIARSIQDWVDSINLLLTDKALWHKLSANSMEYARVQYSRATGIQRMRAIIQEVGLSPQQSGFAH